LWRVFGADPLRCPKRARIMRVHAVVRGAWTTLHVLRCLALPGRVRLEPISPSPPDERTFAFANHVNNDPRSA
jgi:hypothetical protein